MIEWKKTIILFCTAALLLGGCRKEKAAPFTYADCKELQFDYKVEDMGQDPLLSQQTGLRIDEDGSFKASCAALLFEDTGEDYPGGTMRYASAFGQLGTPEKVDAYTYKASVTGMEYANEAGSEEIRDGLRIVYTEVYGLEDAEEFIIYLPGKKVADLPEAYKEDVQTMLAGKNGEMPETLPFYGIFNEAAGAGFIGTKVDGQ